MLVRQYTRHILTFLIIAALLFTLVACGQTTAKSGETTASQMAETTANPNNPVESSEIAVSPSAESSGVISPSSSTAETSAGSSGATTTTPAATTASTTTTTNTTTPTTTTLTTVNPVAPLPYTNWTQTAQGQILWYNPAPAMIAYNSRVQVSVTIPEGYTLVDICKLLEKKGIQTFYHLFSAALNGDYPSYGFIDTSRATANRRYALEGYLFPDTYKFYVGESPYNIWAKFLSNTNAVLAGYTPYPGMTMDQVITLASLIEEEAFTGDTRANVSSVLHNRLNSGKRLELDKTINYVEWYIKPLIQSNDTMVINAFNSYYNTYKCAALPSGPITNPGRMAIEAAINPAVTNYLYFVTDAAGNYYYAATWEEHLANLKTVGLA
jgi:UPF0755 protein